MPVVSSPCTHVRVLGTGLSVVRSFRSALRKVLPSTVRFAVADQDFLGPFSVANEAPLMFWARAVFDGTSRRRGWQRRGGDRSTSSGKPGSRSTRGRLSQWARSSWCCTGWGGNQFHRSFGGRTGTWLHLRTEAPSTVLCLFREAIRLQL